MFITSDLNVLIINTVVPSDIFFCKSRLYLNKIVSYLFMAFFQYLCVFASVIFLSFIEIE